MSAKKIKTYLGKFRKSLQSEASSENFVRLEASLATEATCSTNFMVLIISSCLIASFGLISNSAAVIIGAMIIAPLMLPIRAIAFGALEGNLHIFRNSLASLFYGILTALMLSMILGRVTGIPEFGSEVLARTQPNLVDLGVAVAAGSVSAYAKLRPQISDALAGTAIAVALMPPLCTIGLTLSQGFWSGSWGAFLLFITNLLGIAFACMVVFVLSGYARVSRALGVTSVLIALLLLPLGVSFYRLVRQSQLQATLRRNLVNRTVTIGQAVRLYSTQINWQKNPPEVMLGVAADKPITSKQVKLVEDFISREMGQKFTLVIELRPIQEVRAQE